MKIAIFSPWAISDESIGGTERFVFDLATGLSKEGVAVEEFLLSGKDFEQGNVRFRSLNILGSHKIANEFDLRNLFGDFSKLARYKDFAKKVEALVDIDSFDIILSNSLLLLRAWPAKRRVFVIHTNPFEFEQDWGSNGYRAMVNVLAEEARNRRTVIVAPSRYYANVYSNLANIEVVTLPHAIDSTRLSMPDIKASTQKQFGLNPTLTTVLVPGRLEPLQKRPRLVLEALMLLPAAQRYRYQLVLSGLDSHYGNEADELHRFAQQQGIPIVIRAFKDMAEAYSLSDIVVLPSRSESFGYTALESLSLGIPTILNAIPSYKEIAEDAHNVIFFENDVDSLANSILQLPDTLHRCYQPLAWKKRYSSGDWTKSYVDLFNAIG